MDVFRVVTGISFTNTYIIIENGSAVVIDPGADFDCIKDFITKHGAKPEYVLITHGHFDHVGEVSAFAALGAKVYISAADYEILKSHDFDWDLGFGKTPVKPFDADVLLRDGDEFTAIGHKFKVLSTPGHSPGSICYIMDDLVMFSGDTLFHLTVGRSDLDGSDHAELMRSLDRLFCLDGDYSVQPGHGKNTTLDFERLNNPYAKDKRN